MLNLSRDGETLLKAILQRILTHPTLVLKIGEKLDADTTVPDIQSKQVTL